jgi:hypothetical protein
VREVRRGGRHRVEGRELVREEGERAVMGGGHCTMYCNTIRCIDHLSGESEVHHAES